jgi:SAM-dependent methyltransferase
VKCSWEQAYARETANFLENRSDEGVIWFEESDAENRILRYLHDLELPASTSFLDVGTGNGHLLFELLDNEDVEYSGGAIVGIDYSEKSIMLSQRIAEERGMAEKVRFEAVDIIKDSLQNAPWVPDGGFDVVLDKGTLDAISLSEETLEDGRRVYACYSEKVEKVMKKGALLVVTSCNWTEEELSLQIEKCEGDYCSVRTRNVGTIC